jgi:zinc transporter 1/2/3
MLALPGKEFTNASALTSTTGGAGNTGSSAATTAVKVVDVDVSQLEVVVAAPPSGSAASNSNGSHTAVDLSKILDIRPPVITLLGLPYVEISEMSSYIDAGVTVYDDIDGSSVSSVSRISLCTRPRALGPIPKDFPYDISIDPNSLNASDASILSCSRTSVAVVNTTAPTFNASSNDGGSVYVYTYTAKDTAGNQAAPLRRYVAVLPRCSPPERWCEREGLTACSMKGLCSRGLAALGSTGGQAAASIVAAMKYVPPVDRTPPKLRLLGSGVAAITATGKQNATLDREGQQQMATWAVAGAKNKTK